MSEKVFPDDFPDGFYLNKDGKLYAVDVRIASQFRKAVNLFTGEVIYPSNAARIREMSNRDLADWICDILHYHGKLYTHTDHYECDPDCPLYKCCNDGPDNIEDWLKSPAEEGEG